MKTEARIIVRPKDSGSEIVTDLGLMYPEWLEGDKFVCRLPWSDARVSRIIEYLAMRGFKPRARRPNPEDYRLDIERTYSPSDLRASDYLFFVAKTSFYSERRAPDGLVEFKAQEIRPDADFASAVEPWTFVSERIKTLFEGAGMAHFAFRETRILGPSGAPSTRTKSRYWELTSNLILPPMGEPCRFVDGRTEEEVSGDCPRPFVMREGLESPEYLCSPAEPHYNADSIRRVGSFDLARTFERMRGGDEGGFLVCSQ